MITDLDGGNERLGFDIVSIPPGMITDATCVWTALDLHTFQSLQG